MTGGVDVGPHDFSRVKPTLLERLRDLGPFCSGCYIAPEHHPVEVWSEARPWGDRTRRGPATVYSPEDR